MTNVAEQVEFQSTLPRGSDMKYVIRARWVDISIHAPSRERRVYLRTNQKHRGISIHAPSRERHKLA